MPRPSRQGIVVSTVVLLGTAAVLALAARSSDRKADAVFWFEPVTYGASEAMVERLGGPILQGEMAAIEAAAASELARAFAGFHLTLTSSRDATYGVRVVQDLQHPVSPRYPGPAGQSRAVAGFGGRGAVSFRTLANNAIAYAPAGATREAILQGVGLGIGRAAAHELAHQLLGYAAIHETRDVESYEYASAYRYEQYYGPMHWDIAEPLLMKRLGPAGGSGAEAGASRAFTPSLE